MKEDFYNSNAREIDLCDDFFEYQKKHDVRRFQLDNIPFKSFPPVLSRRAYFEGTVIAPP